MNPLVAAVGPKALWYLTRGTGAVSLLLLTAVVVLGIANSVRWAPGATPRFVVQRVHRNLSLLVLAFIAIHVATAVVDAFAPIRWLDAIVPFASGYRPFWLGLGAVAFDILLAVAITSLVRSHLGYGTWRAIHWTAYASWAVAVFHGLGAGSDSRQPWMVALVLASTVVVVLAVAWRAVVGWTAWTPGRLALTLGTAAIVPALAVWALLGPMRPGWADVAGTPTSLLASGRAGATSGSTPARPLVLPSQASFRGSARFGPSTLAISAATAGSPRLGVDIRLLGTEGSQGFSVRGGNVVLTPPQGAARYTGSILGVSNGVVVATLSDGHGDAIEIRLAVQFPSAGSVSGQMAIRSATASVSPQQGATPEVE